MKHTEDFIDFVRSAIVNYYKTQWRIDITEYDVFIVWFSKTLQNFKAIAATKAMDDRLFEVTWDGDQNRGYLDSYIKMANVIVKPEDVWGKAE